MSAPSLWPAAQNAALWKHLDAGMSASAAAAVLSSEFGIRITRNAVIGRARRQGMPLKGGARGRTVKPKPPKREKPLRPKLPLQRPAPGPKLPTSTAELRCDPVTPGTLHLLELEEGMCRYPTGEGAENIRFCGRHRIDGRAYCCAHVRMCFRAFDPRPQSTFRHMGRA